MTPRTLVLKVNPRTSPRPFSAFFTTICSKQREVCRGPTLRSEDSREFSGFLLRSGNCSLINETSLEALFEVFCGEEADVVCARHCLRDDEQDVEERADVETQREESRRQEPVRRDEKPCSTTAAPLDWDSKGEVRVTRSSGEGGNGKGGRLQWQPLRKSFQCQRIEWTDPVLVVFGTVDVFELPNGPRIISEMTPPNPPQTSMINIRKGRCFSVVTSAKERRKLNTLFMLSND